VPAALLARDLKRTLTAQQGAALRRINNIDLADVRARAIVHERWTTAQATLGEKWYRGYLWLVYIHGGRPVYGIVAESDEMWHAHILFTKRYRADSQRLFGKYLDHTPIKRIDKRYRAGIEQAVDWYNAEFIQQFVASPDLTGTKRVAMTRGGGSGTSQRWTPINLIFPCF
jgi:hypothetical protein